MNLLFLRPALACLLLAALASAMALDAAPTPPPLPTPLPVPVPVPVPVPRPVVAPLPPSALSLALAAVEVELKAAKFDTGELLVNFARLDTFHLSAPTRAKLAKVFGDSVPATLEAVPARAGVRAYRFTLAPFSYLDPNGSSAAWTTLLIETSATKGGRDVQGRGQWPSLDIADKDTRLALRGMRFTMQQRRDADDQWLGPMNVTLSSASVEGVSKPYALRWSDIALDANATAHGKLMDVSQAMTSARFDVAGLQFDALHAATRVVNLDYAALRAFSQYSNSFKGDSTLTPQQTLAAVKPLLQALARSAVKNGSAIVFDNISARFHGYQASLSGRVALPQASDADLATLPTALRKLVAHLDVRVPVAMVRELALALNSQAPADAPAPTPQAAAEAADAITKGIVDKLLEGGYATLADGVLVSHLEMKDGALTANGKLIDLGPTAHPAPVPPIGEAPRAPVRTPTRTPPPSRAAMPARALTDRCRMPPLPPEAARQRLTLETATAFTVGADGRARDVRMTRSSGWPDFDAAVLDATRRCEWLPALVNGEPVDSPAMQRHVTRPPEDADVPK